MKLSTYARIIVKEFKARFPAVEGVAFTVVFKEKVIADGKEVWGTFDVRGPWNPKFKRGHICISLDLARTPKQVGEVLVHELLHGYFKKRQGLDDEIEEVVVEAADEELFLEIRRSIRKRLPRFGEKAEVEFPTLRPVP